MEEYKLKAIVSGFRILTTGEAKLTFEISMAEVPQAAAIAMLQDMPLILSISKDPEGGEENA